MSLPPFSFSTTEPVALESVPPTAYIGVPPPPPYPLPPPQETMPAKTADTIMPIKTFRMFITIISFRDARDAKPRLGGSQFNRRVDVQTPPRAGLFRRHRYIWQKRASVATHKEVPAGRCPSDPRGLPRNY